VGIKGSAFRIAIAMACATGVGQTADHRPGPATKSDSRMGTAAVPEFHFTQTTLNGRLSDLARHFLTQVVPNPDAPLSADDEWMEGLFADLLRAMPDKRRYSPDDADKFARDFWQSPALAVLREAPDHERMEKMLSAFARALFIPKADLAHEIEDLYQSGRDPDRLFIDRLAWQHFLHMVQPLAALSPDRSAAKWVLLIDSLWERKGEVSPQILADLVEGIEPDRRAQAAGVMRQVLENTRKWRPMLDEQNKTNRMALLIALRQLAEPETAQADFCSLPAAVRGDDASHQPCATPQQQEASRRAFQAVRSIASDRSHLLEALHSLVDVDPETHHHKVQLAYRSRSIDPSGRDHFLGLLNGYQDRLRPLLDSFGKLGRDENPWHEDGIEPIDAFHEAFENGRGEVVAKQAPLETTAVPAWAKTPVSQTRAKGVPRAPATVASHQWILHDPTEYHAPLGEPDDRSILGDFSAPEFSPPKNQGRPRPPVLGSAASPAPEPDPAGTPAGEPSPAVTADQRAQGPTPRPSPTGSHLVQAPPAATPPDDRPHGLPGISRKAHGRTSAVSLTQPQALPFASYRQPSDGSDHARSAPKPGGAAPMPGSPGPEGPVAATGPGTAPQLKPVLQPQPDFLFAMPKDTAVTALAEPVPRSPGKDAASNPAEGQPAAPAGPTRGFSIRGTAARPDASLFPVPQLAAAPLAPISPAVVTSLGVGGDYGRLGDPGASPASPHPVGERAEKAGTPVEETSESTQQDEKDPTLSVTTRETRIANKNTVHLETDTLVRDAKGKLVRRSKTTLITSYSYSGVDEKETVREIDPKTGAVIRITETNRHRQGGELVLVDRTVTTLQKPECPALRVRTVEDRQDRSKPIETTTTTFNLNCQPVKVLSQSSARVGPGRKATPAPGTPSDPPAASEARVSYRPPTRMPKGLFDIQR
jgi:hypothetical protein